MKLTLEFFNLLLLILPGLVASQVFYSASGSEQKELPARIIDSLIFSFIIYILAGLFIPWEPILQTKVISGAMQFVLTKNKYLILLNIILIILVPLSFTALHHNDILMKILRQLNITTKSSRPNTWSDVFLSQDRHIIVHLKDGRRVRGYPERFSTDPKEGFVYLFNPAWIKNDNNKSFYIETGAHGFLINREEIDLIEFSLNKEETLENGA